MKRGLLSFLGLCMLLGGFPVRAEESAEILGNVMYATTMEIREIVGNGLKAGGLNSLQGKDGSGNLKSDTSVSSDLAVFFNTGAITPGVDYIEMNFPTVSEVDALRFRSRGNIQRIENAKITYLDQQDGAWKTAYESIDCSEDGQDANLYWKTVSFSEPVKTAKIRVYPLSYYKDYGNLRLDGLLALGSSTEEKLYGNLLYGSSVSLTSDGAWISHGGGAATIDGKYRHDNDAALRFPGTSNQAVVEYLLPEEKRIDYFEITSFDPQHMFQNGSVSVWNSALNRWSEEVPFENADGITNATFGRKCAELPQSCKTNKIRISVNDAQPSENVVSLSEVYAGAYTYDKLDSLYFTNYSLVETNKDACNADMSHLHEDGIWDKAPGDSGYGNVYDSVYFKAAEGTAEQYVEMLLGTPAELQRIVIKTADAAGGFGKPGSASVSYLDHESGEWMADGTIQIPEKEYISDYYFSKRVYADAVRISFPGNFGNQFKLAGLYAVGDAKNIRHNNRNALYGAGIKDNNGVAVGKLIDGNFSTGTIHVTSSNKHLWINPSAAGAVNQIELVYRQAISALPRVVVSYYGNGGWHNDIEEGSFDASGYQTFSEKLNPVRHKINLSKTYQTAPGQTWTLRFEDFSGSTSLAEIIFRETELHDISEFTADGEISEQSAAARIAYTGSETRNATVIMALYDENGRLQKAVSKQHNFSAGNPAVTMKTDTAQKAESAKIYIWEDSLTPVSGVLSLDTKLLLQNPGNDLILHNTAVENYLQDTYDSAEKYANGKQQSDLPQPVTLRWKWTSAKSTPEEYLVRLSESQTMEKAETFTVNREYAEVYNLKVGIRYYWTVSYQDETGWHTSKTQSFSTEEHAPRLLKVDGVRNIRDIGGWNTADGGKVKQGKVFRSWRFSYWQNGTVKTEIEPAGIQTLCGQLQIKSEIDIRDWSEIPESVTESVLGSEIRYVRAPMNYEDDYLSQNIESIRKIFSELADEKNYPMVYHCAAGADRTAAVTYLLNGLLGVEKEDLLRDYLITNFSHQDGFRQLSGITELYVKTLDAYRGDTLSEKIYHYLNEVVQIPAEDLDFIIQNLKEV